MDKYICSVFLHWNPNSRNNTCKDTANFFTEKSDFPKLPQGAGLPNWEGKLHED